MSKKREIRALTQELRVKPDSSTLTGYIAVFNTLSEDLGGFKEKLAPGCFASSMGADVRCLINHDTSAIVGRTAAKTLRLVEDDRGLAFECDLPDTTRAKDLMVSVQRNDVTGCSFGFFCAKDEWDYDAGIRTVLDTELFEVSVGVTFPAYTDTSAYLRSLFPDGTVTPEKRDEADPNDADSVGNESGTCECGCEQCTANLCAECSNEDCTDENCRCNRSKKQDDEDDDDYERCLMRLRVAESF